MTCGAAGRTWLGAGAGQAVGGTMPLRCCGVTLVLCVRLLGGRAVAQTRPMYRFVDKYSSPQPSCRGCLNRYPPQGHIAAPARTARFSPATSTRGRVFTLSARFFRRSETARNVRQRDRNRSRAPSLGRR